MVWTQIGLVFFTWKSIKPNWGKTQAKKIIITTHDPVLSELRSTDFSSGSNDLWEPSQSDADQYNTDSNGWLVVMYNDSISENDISVAQTIEKRKKVTAQCRENYESAVLNVEERAENTVLRKEKLYQQGHIFH